MYFLAYRLAFVMHLRAVYLWRTLKQTARQSLGSKPSDREQVPGFPVVVFLFPNRICNPDQVLELPKETEIGLKRVKLSVFAC